MRMSQGRFLMLVLISGIIASTSAFLLEPKNDWYCMLSGPTILIPIQIMLAVVFGRLLRIVRIMGRLMDWNKQKSGMFDRMSGAFRQRSTQGGDLSRDDEEDLGADSRGSTFANPIRATMDVARNIRQHMTVPWLWAIILIITLPQVIAQVIGIALFPYVRQLRLTEDEANGRFECGVEGKTSHNYALITICITFLTLMATMIMAQRSRKLPGLFNEAESVSTALLATVVVSTFSFTLVIAADDPSSVPDVPFVMLVVIVLTLCLSLSVKLVVPKLKLIWKGEKVVMSKIMEDHKRILDGSSQDDTGTDVNKPRSTRMEVALQTSSSPPSTQEAPELGDLEDDSELLVLEPSSSFSIRTKERKQEKERKAKERKEQKKKEKRKDKDKPRPLRMIEGKDPPRELMVNIVALGQNVSSVNDRMLSGLTVSKEEWLELQQALQESQGLLERTTYE